MLRLAAVFALALFVPLPAFAQEDPASPTSPGFDPAAYIGRGNAYNCSDFASEADPSDPNKLDTDRPKPDGIACENNPAPFDTVPVPRRSPDDVEVHARSAERQLGAVPGDPRQRAGPSDPHRDQRTG
jgi:hypothetical protein